MKTAAVISTVLNSRPLARGAARAFTGRGMFLAVILARLIVLFRSSDTQHFLPMDGDMKFYHDWACRIVGGQWTDHQSFYGLPLYAYLLAGLYALVGVQPYFALLLQVLAEGTTGLLIYQIALLAFAPPAEPTGDRTVEHFTDARVVGCLAALGWAFFVPAQAYSTILMPTIYFVASFWSIIWWILRAGPGWPRRRAFFLLGLSMGFVAMMVANILLLSVLVLAALFYRRSWTRTLPAGLLFLWQRRVVAVLLLIGGIGCGTSPCWLHNYFVAGEPVLLSAHGGINFWIGNNPDANGYPKIPGGLSSSQEGLLKDSITFAEKAVGRPLRHYEVSAYWSRQAHRYIVEHPADFLRLIGVKLGNFWNAYRYDDLGVVIVMQEDGVLLPGIGFGVVAALGLPGLVLAAARRSRARWVAAAVLLHMASVLTVFVTERYRLAAVPGLLLLGSFGLVETFRLLAAHRWLPVLSYGALAAAAVLFVGRAPSSDDLMDHDDYNTAIADMANYHLDRARPKLERVYARHPNNPEAAFALANMALADSQTSRAAQYFRRTLELEPRHYRAMNNLGVLAMEQGQWQAARTLFTRALELAPQDAKMEYLLAQVCVSLDDLTAARAAIGQAVRLAPDRTMYQLYRTELDRKIDPATALR